MAKAGGLKGVALIGGAANSTVAGALHFFQEPSTGYTEVRGKVTGLAPGRHGFHIHVFGDTTNGCISTGPHFNPHNKPHGAPFDEERHVGDLGNIIANEDGVAEVFIRDLQISLSGPHSILGRAVVVHADPDDLGRGRITDVATCPMEILLPISTNVICCNLSLLSHSIMASHGFKGSTMLQHYHTRCYTMPHLEIKNY